MSSPLYQHILLKLSGESLKGNEPFGVDPSILDYLSEEIKSVLSLGVQLGIVIGGGNYFRGSQANWMPRVSADQVGIMATVMNGLVLAECFRQRAIPCRLFNSFAIEGVVGQFSQNEVNDTLQNKQVAIFSGGTAHPFFSTDTAAALRAGQMNAQLLMKATQVDGIYDADPQVFPHARRFENISFTYVLQHDLRVMDATSVSFCREYDIPILVCDVSQSGNLRRAVLGEAVGTIIRKSTEKGNGD